MNAGHWRRHGCFKTLDRLYAIPKCN